MPIASRGVMPELGKPEAESGLYFVESVNFTRSQASILATRLLVEETSSTLPSKPELGDHQRRFRDERWPERIPERYHFEKSLPRRVTDQHHKLAVLGLRSP